MKKIIVLTIAFFISMPVIFAQAAKNDTTHQMAYKYHCDMHPDVVSNKPGKCSKCGMALTKIKTYTCTMHPDVISHESGKCPKCGMDMTEVKTKPKTKKA